MQKLEVYEQVAGVENIGCRKHGTGVGIIKSHYTNLIDLLKNLLNYLFEI
jgi:hypothetical protein